jgi:hypothetical protein
MYTSTNTYFTFYYYLDCGGCVYILRRKDPKIKETREKRQEKRDKD